MTMQDMGRFKAYSGDVDFINHGGTWWWMPPTEGREVVHFIRCWSWEDYCSEIPGYGFDLRVVIPSLVPHRRVSAALESAGAREEACAALEADDYQRLTVVIAGALQEYGACLTESFSGTNWWKTMAEVKRASLAYDWEEGLEKPVNRIGQTGYELLQGDLASSFARAGEEGRLLAKMYVAAEGKTLGGQIDGGQLAMMKEIAGREAGA